MSLHIGRCAIRHHGPELHVIDDTICADITYARTTFEQAQYRAAACARLADAGARYVKANADSGAEYAECLAELARAFAAGEIDSDQRLAQLLGTESAYRTCLNLNAHDHDRATVLDRAMLDQLIRAGR